MRRLLTALFPLALTPLAACSTSRAPTAAAPARPWAYGVELQGYPAGGIAMAQAWRRAGPGALHLRAGANVTERSDFGEHDDESGAGAGLGVGYRQRLGPQPRSGSGGWSVGARLDLWRLKIDWRDDPSPAAPSGRAGDTDIWVLQPALEAGYAWTLGRDRLELMLGVGAEINVATSGEDVGEGAIGLIGLTYLFGTD
jgi:hypothetical protein